MPDISFINQNIKMDFNRFVVFIVILPNLAIGDYEEIKVLQAQMPSAKLEVKAIRECPLTISKNLPFDYRSYYNETLPLKLLFAMYRFVGINDLQQTVSLVGILSIHYTLNNCGFENGTNITFVLSERNQWVPRLYYDTAMEHYYLPNR